MAILSSSIKKIILLFLISLLIFMGWMAGAEGGYAKVLVGATNFSLGIVKNDTRIELEDLDDKGGLYQFRVYTRIDGRLGNYPQETEGLMQPFVIILSWQIFLFFVLRVKSAFQSLVVNVGIFFLIQIIFLILLTGYYDSTIQQYIYTMLLDSFYIIALILIIKDNMLYPVFRKKIDVREK